MLNSAILMGRLTAEPELRHTQTGIAVVRFTLAVNRSFVRQGEERKTDFIDIVAWRHQAEFVEKYFHKGQLVAVEGSIQTGSYQDRDGNKRKSFEVVASNVHFAESFHGRADYSQASEPASNDSYSSQVSPAYTNGNTGDFEEVTEDDDLPF